MARLQSCLVRDTMDVSMQVRADDAERVRFIGNRVVRNGDGSCTFDYQSIVEMCLKPMCQVAGDLSEACRLDIQMIGGRSFFNVILNGVMQGALAALPGSQSRLYSIPLPGADRVDGVVRLQLVKRNEAVLGQVIPPRRTGRVTISGFSITSGWELAPLLPPLPLKIEFIGDSDTAAFGNEGPPTELKLHRFLSLDNKYQNISNSSGHCLCRMLNAEPSVVAWSGVGVHQNAVACGNTLLRDYYQRNLASSDAHLHDFGDDWVPQLVICHVGANDLYGGKKTPSHDDFVESYAGLLDLVREKRPSAIILCCVYSLETPEYKRQGAIRGGLLTELTQRAVDAHRQRFGSSLVYVEEPDGGLVWPHDGGSIEHWGTTGMVKYANALCDTIERLSLQWPGGPWKRVESEVEARSLEYVENPESLCVDKRSGCVLS